MHSLARRLVLASITILALIAGCGVRTPLEIGMDGSARPRDGGTADAPRLDAGPCRSGDDCDDGRMCNGREICAAGRCQSGMPLFCNDELECTIDECVEGLGCVSRPDDTRCPPGSRCDPLRGCIGGSCVSDPECDDGLTCNGTEICAGGSCVSLGPPRCDDGIECTLDLCDEPFGTCTFEPDPSRCPPGAICDPMRGCIGGRCRSPLDCDDGRFCNGIEECRDGMCVPGAPPRCEDGIACTVESCSEFSGGCVSTPDSSRCPMGEICDPFAGDPDGCVVRRCRPGTRDCDDGFMCNGTEACGRDGRCLPGVPPPCDDFQPCTLDRCEEGFGCVNEPRSPFETCGNMIDDDCDGLIDCDDFECRGTPGCPTCVPRSMIEVDCFDGLDDDCDTLLDCADRDCARACIPAETNCDNRIDDDRDGLIDCADPDCRGSPRCAVDGGSVTGEIGIAACTNMRDDDRDGRTDCRDPDCTPIPMGECCNGIDDDGDGLTDIATCRCFEDSTCVGVGNLEQVCWESTFSVCLPRCNFYGGDAFCRMWFPDLPRCNRTNGECMR